MQTSNPVRDQAGLLRPDETCWRIARTGKLSFLIDAAAYFAAARTAMAAAKRHIMLLGWDFDPRTRLSIDEEPDAQGNTIGSFLSNLKERKPELDIRVLIWDAALPIAIGQGLYPQRSRKWLDHGIDFRLDATPPYGASCHQKVLVVDDEIAFCGGIDFGPDRLDIFSHPDRAAWRRRPGGAVFCARHDVMTMVNGAAAQALGDLARARWLRATSEILSPDKMPDAQSWPGTIKPDVENIDVAIIRTEPAHRHIETIRESEALHIAAIRKARHSIYLENQYFASPLIAGALAQRLSEADGPEIVLILSEHSPSYFDRSTMDNVRGMLLAQLKRADRFGRFQAYAARTGGGCQLIVHSKIAIIDNVLARVGSTNLNNRSFGFDMECDLALEAREPEAEKTQQAIEHLRTRLIAHFIGCSDAVFDKALKTEGGLIAAIDALRQRHGHRLTPIPSKTTVLGRFIARLHLGDPTDVSDSWWPWLRYFKISRRAKALFGEKPPL